MLNTPVRVLHSSFPAVLLGTNDICKWQRCSDPSLRRKVDHSSAPAKANPSVPKSKGQLRSAASSRPSTVKASAPAFPLTTRCVRLLRAAMTSVQSLVTHAIVAVDTFAARSKRDSLIRALQDYDWPRITSICRKLPAYSVRSIADELEKVLPAHRKRPNENCSVPCPTKSSVVPANGNASKRSGPVPLPEANRQRTAKLACAAPCSVTSTGSSPSSPAYVSPRLDDLEAAAWCAATSLPTRDETIDDAHMRINSTFGGLQQLEQIRLLRLAESVPNTLDVAYCLVTTVAGDGDSDATS